MSSQSIQPLSFPAITSTSLIMITVEVLQTACFTIFLLHHLTLKTWDDTSAGQLQLNVQFLYTITDSWRDDESDVAMFQFSDMLKRHQQASVDPYGFPNKTTIGTLRNDVKPVEPDEQGQTE